MGCGPGNSAQMLSRAFPKATIIGLDVNARMVAYANEHNTYTVDYNGNRVKNRCKFFHQSICSNWNKDWPDELKELLQGQVDAIFSNYALAWVDNFNELAQNVAYLLRPSSGAVFVGNLLYCGDIINKWNTEEERELIRSLLHYPREAQFVSDFMLAFRNVNFNRFSVKYEEPLSRYRENFYKHSKWGIHFVHLYLTKQSISRFCEHSRQSHAKVHQSSRSEEVRCGRFLPARHYQTSDLCKSSQSSHSTTEAIHINFVAQFHFFGRFCGL